MLLIFSTTNCGKQEKNNHIPPEISEIRFNENMKVGYLADTLNNIYDTITLNKSSKPLDIPDTLVIDYPITLSGLFKSENGLTNMKIHIWGDTLNIMPTDTCLNITQVPTSYFFGKHEEYVKDLSVYSTIPAKVISSSNSTKTIRTGDEYKFSIFCIDRLGNINDTSYNNKKIVLVNLQTLISNKKK